MMLLRDRDNNIQSFAYIWLHKGNQNEFLNFYFWMLKEFVLISFMKPDVRKTLKTKLQSSFVCIRQFSRLLVLQNYAMNVTSEAIFRIQNIKNVNTSSLFQAQPVFPALDAVVIDLQFDEEKKRAAKLGMLIPANMTSD